MLRHLLQTCFCDRLAAVRGQGLERAHGCIAHASGMGLWLCPWHQAWLQSLASGAGSWGWAVPLAPGMGCCQLGLKGSTDWSWHQEWDGRGWEQRWRGIVSAACHLMLPSRRALVRYCSLSNLSSHDGKSKAIAPGICRSMLHTRAAPFSSAGCSSGPCSMLPCGLCVSVSVDEAIWLEEGGARRVRAWWTHDHSLFAHLCRRHVWGL